MVRFLLRAMAAALGPRAQLIAENLCLRQQLLVLQRRRPQPPLYTMRSGGSGFALADGSAVGETRCLLSTPKRC